MDFELSDEQQSVRDWVRTFVTSELVPLENEVLRNERAGRPGIDREQIRALQLKARQSGFWGITTPQEYGGIDVGTTQAAIITMELGRTFVPFRFGGEADNILYAANAEQRETHLLPTIEGDRRSCFALTEPGAGSDARAIRTTAVPDGDDWVINGEKIFITGGNEADFAMVFAVTDPAAAPGEGVTCFLVERDMGWKSAPIETMGEWGPAALQFEDVRVPARNILGELHRGFQLAMQWIGQGRWLIPSRAIGACERLLQMAVDHSKTRRTFGKPLADRQAIQWMIADSAVELEAAKWLVMHAAWQAERGLDARHSVSMAKLFGTNAANQIVDRVMQIHGGMGYTRELPIERWYRELRLTRIFEGTDEILRMNIARNLLRGHVRLGSWD